MVSARKAIAQLFKSARIAGFVGLLSGTALAQPIAPNPFEQAPDSQSEHVRKEVAGILHPADLPSVNRCSIEIARFMDKKGRFKVRSGYGYSLFDLSYMPIQEFANGLSNSMYMFTNQATVPQEYLIELMTGATIYSEWDSNPRKLPDEIVPIKLYVLAPHLSDVTGSNVHYDEKNQILYVDTSDRTRESLDAAIALYQYSEKLDSQHMIYGWKDESKEIKRAFNSSGANIDDLLKLLHTALSFREGYPDTSRIGKLEYMGWEPKNGSKVILTFSTEQGYIQSRPDERVTLKHTFLGSGYSYIGDKGYDICTYSHTSTGIGIGVASKKGQSNDPFNVGLIKDPLPNQGLQNFVSRTTREQTPVPDPFAGIVTE